MLSKGRFWCSAQPFASLTVMVMEDLVQAAGLNLDASCRWQAVTGRRDRLGAGRPRLRRKVCATSPRGEPQGLHPQEVELLCSPVQLCLPPVTLLLASTCWAILRGHKLRGREAH